MQARPRSVRLFVFFSPSVHIASTTTTADSFHIKISFQMFLFRSRFFRCCLSLVVRCVSFMPIEHVQFVRKGKRSQQFMCVSFQRSTNLSYFISICRSWLSFVSIHCVCVFFPVLKSLMQLMLRLQWTCVRRRNCCCSCYMGHRSAPSHSEVNKIYTFSFK